MKRVASALLALSLLTGFAAPASAGFDTKSFFAQLERWSGGSCE